MEVRHFRYVVALAQEMNFSAAARRLNIAQPALSQNIRQVEDELGVTLFERSTRKVVLTDAGRAFYRGALTILANVESAGRTAQRVAHGGSLTIGFTTTAILGGELPRLIRAFHEKFPEIHLTLEDFTVNVLMDKLRTAAIDIACTEEIFPDESQETRPLKPLPVVLAMYKKHPLAKRKQLSLRMAANEQFILPMPFRTWAVHEAFVRACEQSGFKPECAGYSSNAAAAVGMAATNMGVALMHELPLLRCPEVVFRRLTEPKITLRMYLVWRKSDLSEAAGKFIDSVG